MANPLQIYEEKYEKECCLTCKNLIVKNNNNGHINFCGHCGKIILDMHLGSGNMRDCNFERKAE